MVRDPAILGQGAECGTEAHVRKGRRVNPVGDVADVSDRGANLRLRCFERRLLAAIGRRTRPGEPDRQREASEPLLRSVMQVPLEAPSLPVACLDHARSRRAELRQARPGYGNEALVLQRKTGRADDLAHSVCILGDSIAMLDCSDDLALAHQRRDVAARLRTKDRRLASYGDERPSSRGIGKDKLWIAKEAAQTILEPARIRASQLEDDPRDG